MNETVCRSCGQTVNAAAEICPHCGVRLLMPPAQKSKLAAALLAFFLGGLGIHKFYLGKTLWGIIYLVFCWTGIPSIIGFIEGILYLIKSEEAFHQQYG